MGFSTPSWDSVYNDLRAILELLSFAASVGVLLVAYKALGQLKIAKDDIASRVTREAAKEAAQQLDHWATTIVPALEDVVREENRLGLERRAERMERFEFEELQQRPAAAKAHYDAYAAAFNANPAFKTTLLRACNLVEASAMCLTTGVANEEVAFLPLAKVFCDFVEQHYTVYTAMRRAGELNRWEYTVKLYRIWSQRRAKHELGAQQTQINAALARATADAAPVRPLGMQ